MSRAPTRLKGLSDIRRYFHRNDTPIFFISATNFNLLGMDEWCKNFKFVNYIDCYDGRHPNTFVPSEAPHPEFGCIEDINNYLLQHKEVLDYIRSHGAHPKAVFLMFDEQTEAVCQEAGLKIWFPRARLRTRVDNKLNTVRIGHKAGVKSVPNVLAPVGSYDELREVAGHLGPDLVLQTAFGDSGHTTFFLSSEQDWNKHAREIVGAGDVKIMKRIRCRGSAIEACATRNGTIVGPLMTELVGFKELTPYRGGWCGNEIFAAAFTDAIRQQARDLTFRFGEQLRKEGYRGYFELDFLVDHDDGEVYLGELNPRITGASSMTNHAAFAHADAPLFLFHLLEFSGIDFDLDIQGLNERWADPENVDSWSQMVIKHTENVRRPSDACAAERHLASERRRLDRLLPVRLPPPGRRQRARSLVPAHQRSRRLSLRGRRPRDPDHPGPADDPRLHAQRAGAQVDRRHPRKLRRNCPGGHSASCRARCGSLQDTLEAG